MSDKIQNLSAAVEALLFAYGEPLNIKKISEILNIEEGELKSVLDDLDEKLKSGDRGLTLIQSENKIQLATKPDYSSFLENLIKEEFKESLTPAALETLSLIAYLGPISRIKIEYFRGVNSSFILRTLMMRGLIERQTDAKERGFVYSLSFDSLKHLGVQKIEELPDYEKYRNNLSI